METHFYTIFAKRVIFKLVEEKIIFEIKEQYKLVGLIAALKRNYYNTIIFNPVD